jgi:peptide-methionine (S)-S-oxide reductase
MTAEHITLGGGCFWCLEAVFNEVQGVLAVESGYCNGHVPDPGYEAVCSGTTGHVEVVQVSFDPQLISLREILHLFFAVHDPSTLNRQGNDVGPQYRSGIYWHDSAQRAVALAAKAEVDAALGGGVVTEILARDNYWKAEAYHQRYFEQHPQQGYCAYVVAPKLAKFRKQFAQRLKA